MARFVKGQSGNPSGRPPKAGDKTLRSTREVIKLVLDNEFTVDKVSLYLKELKPIDRLNILVKLLEFHIPKLKAMDITGEIDMLSDDQASRILNELKRTYIEDKFKNRVNNE